MYRKYIKNLMDKIITVSSLIILIPIFLVISILIKIDSRGPIIFKHKRLGKNCEPIYVWKFRTMVENAINLGPEWTAKNDKRITKLGKILRSTSLDELPQIINIIKGDMSLIGPRPDSYTKAPTEIQKMRTRILPGLTGLAQVNGRSSLTREEKEKYDLEYIEKYNFILDLKIIIKTLILIIKKEGVN